MTRILSLWNGTVLHCCMAMLYAEQMSRKYKNIKNKAPMIHSALFSIAFLCYNNGSETAVYMISLVGETAPSILKLFEESLLKPWVGFFHVLIT